MKTVEDYQKAGTDLHNKLHFSTHPVAVKYIKDKSEIPRNAIWPSKAGFKLALCQAFTHVRRFGGVIAMTSDDNFCVPATGFHHWADITEEELIESQMMQLWHKDRESEVRRFATQREYYTDEELQRADAYSGFLCCPLKDTEFIPDAIVIYCDGEQLTSMLHSLCFEHKHTPSTFNLFEGFGESCVKGGLLPFLKQTPQVFIPGAGDRVFGNCLPHEVGIGIPGELLFYLLENLFRSGGDQNMGYPFNSFVSFSLDENITRGFRFLRDVITQKETERKA